MQQIYIYFIGHCFIVHDDGYLQAKKSLIFDVSSKPGYLSMIGKKYYQKMYMHFDHSADTYLDHHEMQNITVR